MNADMEQKPQRMYRRWGWSLWEADVPIPGAGAGKMNITCKAVDTQHNVQPESISNIWNLRGFLNNSWHRVEVRVNVGDKE